MYAAVVAKGSTDGKLLMSKAKVKPSEISDAKKAVGGGTVLRAATLFENGVYVFELNKEPPATLAQLIKKLAKEQAGLMIRVLCRKGTKLQDLGEEPVRMSKKAHRRSRRKRPAVSPMNTGRSWLS